MKRVIRHIVPLVLLATCVVSCDKESDNGSRYPGVGPVVTKKLALTPIAELNDNDNSSNFDYQTDEHWSLEMDYRTYQTLGASITGNSSPNYPRIKRLKDGSYLLFNHYGDGLPNGCDIFYATSTDLETWVPRGYLFKRYVITNSLGNSDKRGFTNANAVVLPSGEILAFASYRAGQGYPNIACNFDNGIVMVRSTDNGITWSEPQEIYHGANWEAHMLRISTGELQCYFTESRPWISGGHSGTVMIKSLDDGRTWTPGLNKTPYRVIRQNWDYKEGNATHYTDQMPTVIQLKDSKKLAAAVESTISLVNGKYTFNISLAYSDDDGNWIDLTEEFQEGPADRQDNIYDGAAPYLVQFPSGESALSYTASSYLYMRLGDVEARHFGEPFKALPAKGYWAGLENDGDHALIAAMRNSEEEAISLTRYILNHTMIATSREVNIDGGNSEWKKSDDAIFVGSGSQAQATLRCAADTDNVYFLVEVLDENIVSGDYVNIYLSPRTTTQDINSEARRISVSHGGLKRVCQFAGGWTDVDMSVSAKAVCDGTVSDKGDSDNGYLVEVAIKRSELNIKDNELLVNFVMVDNESGEDAVASTMTDKLNGWIPIKGL